MTKTPVNSRVDNKYIWYIFILNINVNKMEVLGSLANLNDDGSLPLPWWHRAPIGLLDKTFAYIALVESENRPVGDLILTVLHPKKWDKMFRIDCSGDDQPGFISKVFNAILPLNIAIAETVTMETGSQHHITLICEPIMGEELNEKVIESNLESVKEIRKKKIRSFFNTPPTVLWHDIVQIEHGWIKNVNWKEELLSRYPNAANEVDLNRIVVSADTTKRLIRYIFPKKGAVSIEIEHADEPGSLKEITNTFANCNTNILSSILRRGGAKPNNAILVAVCEPINNMPSEDFQETIALKLKELKEKHQWLRAKEKIRHGDRSKYIIYPKHPDDYVVRIPNVFLAPIKEYSKSIPTKKTPIFISRRFIEGERVETIVQTVKDVLTENNYYPIEATPETGEIETSIIQILSKMWLCKAGIVLIAGNKDQDGFSINLAHEAGFIQGQAKPLLVLVEEGSNEGDMRAWSNVHGLVAPRFPKDDTAFQSNHKNSIYSTITKWLKTMN